MIYTIYCKLFLLDHAKNTIYNEDVENHSRTRDAISNINRIHHRLEICNELAVKL